ncbi:hypothetical protein SUDANB95_07996 (plasmid) [Actinosynnema sp. ALI-1.44]
MPTAVSDKRAATRRTEPPPLLRAAVVVQVRTLLAELVTADRVPTSGQSGVDQRRDHLDALAASYTLEDLLAQALAEVRVEHAESAAFAGASYSHLGEAAGVTRGRAQQMWPTAGKKSKRRRWLSKHHAEIRAALRDLRDHRAVRSAPDHPALTAIAGVLASDHRVADPIALDQALTSARSMLTDLAIPDTDPARVRVHQIAEAVDAHRTLAPTRPALVLEFPGGRTTAPMGDPPPSWHGLLSPSLVTAVTSVVDLVDRHPLRPERFRRPERIDVVLTRLHHAVGANDPDDVRRVLASLVIRPASAHPYLPEALLDATKAMLHQTADLLLCPTCEHRPAPGCHPAERALHLEYLSQPWLDHVDGRIVRRYHCPRCQPNGYSGIDLTCIRCDQGFMLEPKLARHHDGLPPVLLDWLDRHGWNTTTPTPLHDKCLVDKTGLEGPRT